MDSHSFFADPDQAVVFNVDLDLAETGSVMRFFISWIDPIWDPDKFAKTVSLKNLFLQRYLNFKFEKFESVQSNASTLKSFLKNLGLCCNSTQIFLKFSFLIQAKERSAKAKLFPAKLCAG